MSYNDGKELVYDSSAWHPATDWSQAKAQGVRYVINRASLSYGYKDPCFKPWVARLHALGMYAGCYHYLYPAQPAAKQYDNFMAQIGDGNWDGIPWADIEAAQGCSTAQIEDCLLRFCEMVDAGTGKRTGIYSRASWMNQYLPNRSWINERKWWLAQYLTSGKEHPGPVLMPTGLKRENVLLHQTSAKGMLGGETIDMNRWQGEREGLTAYLGADAVPVVVDDGEKLARLWAAHPELHG